GNHGFAVGQTVTIAGVGVSGYNNTFTITAVPSPTTFRFTVTSSLGASGGGTATLGGSSDQLDIVTVNPGSNHVSVLLTSKVSTVATTANGGASESGPTVTITATAAHGYAGGQSVIIAGVGVGGYNGTFTITNVPSGTSFKYTAGSSGLANSGGGTATATP